MQIFGRPSNSRASFKKRSAGMGEADALSSVVGARKGSRDLVTRMAESRKILTIATDYLMPMDKRKNGASDQDSGVRCDAP